MHPAGTVVRLKSGGPMMTVSPRRMDEDCRSSEVYCDWADAAGEIQRRSFHVDTIEIVPVMPVHPYRR